MQTLQTHFLAMPIPNESEFKSKLGAEIESNATAYHLLWWTCTKTSTYVTSETAWKALLSQTTEILRSLSAAKERSGILRQH